MQLRTRVGRLTLCDRVDSVLATESGLPVSHEISITAAETGGRVGYDTHPRNRDCACYDQPPSCRYANESRRIAHGYIFVECNDRICMRRLRRTVAYRGTRLCCFETVRGGLPLQAIITINQPTSQSSKHFLFPLIPPPSPARCLPGTRNSARYPLQGTITPRGVYPAGVNKQLASLVTDKARLCQQGTQHTPPRSDRRAILPRLKRASSSPDPHTAYH